MPAVTDEIPVVEETPAKWHSVEIVAEPRTEFGILQCGDGILTIALRREGEAWPFGKEPFVGINKIMPGNTTYVVRAN